MLPVIQTFIKSKLLWARRYISDIYLEKGLDFITFCSKTIKTNNTWSKYH